MVNKVEVWLWSRRVGYIDLDRKGYVNFEYDKEFQKSGIQISPIMMPLSNKVYYFPELLTQSFRGVPGLVADSLPDKFGNAVIDNWLARQSRLPESFNVIERLCYIGKRGMGALEYRPYLSNDHDEMIEIDNLVELANNVLKKRENIEINSDKDEAINQLFMVSSSAGGARAKAILSWNKEKNIFKSGQIDAGEGYDYYLLKFDGVDESGDHSLSDPKGFTKIEYAYYLMARDAGIDMSECQLLEENGRSHFITKRFDRINGQKIHAQTFGALCHIDYNIPMQASYELLAQRCIQLGIYQNQIDQLFRRMVFNVLACNNDDHVKNFTFLMDKNGMWSLSPAYDITFSYKPNSLWVSQHQMTINGKGKDITMSDLIACANVMRISKKKAIRIINEVKDVLLNWRNYAKDVSVSENFTESIDYYIRLAIETV